LDVGSLVELLVVVDAEGIAALSDGCACTCGLLWEEAGSHRRHHDEGGDVVEVGDFSPQVEAGYLRVVPVDGKEDRRVAEDAEVERVVGVLPDVVAGDDEVLAEGLLETNMELVAEARLKRSGDAGGTREKRREDSASATLAGDDEVFVERSL
jgi:hypothetical protein